MRHVLALVPLTILAVGCGSVPVPAERMATSESAVTTARDMGAETTPNASLHLQLAREQIAQAKSLIKDGDNERADWVLARAASDAELASALARESRARAEAQSAMAQVQALRQRQQ